MRYHPTFKDQWISDIVLFQELHLSKDYSELFTPAHMHAGVMYANQFEPKFEIFMEWSKDDDPVLQFYYYRAVPGSYEKKWRPDKDHQGRELSRLVTNQLRYQCGSNRTTTFAALCALVKLKDPDAEDAKIRSILVADALRFTLFEIGGESWVRANDSKHYRLRGSDHDRGRRSQ